MPGGKLVEVSEVTRRFRTAEGEVLALDGVSFDIRQGEFGYHTTQAGAIERETKRKVAYFRYADFGVNAPTQGVFIHTKYAGDRSLNCRMVKATTRAWLAAGKDPDGAADALHKLFPKAPEDMEALIRLLTEYGGMERARTAGEYYTNEFFDCA